jgi:hypothetical protein
VYEADMYITPKFPAVLPVFHIMIRYLERFNESDKPVQFRIYLPQVEAPAFEANLDRGAFIPPPDGVDPTERRFSFNVMAQFRDLLLLGEGAIKVRAYRGEDEIQLGSLRVKIHPEIAKAASAGAEAQPAQPPAEASMTALEPSNVEKPLRNRPRKIRTPRDKSGH